nr:immunoglobulin heavy chain junction region [Mus musculus]
CARRGNWDVDW